jgi:hypothetical protein
MSLKSKAQASVIDLSVSFILFTTVFLINYYVWNSINASIINNDKTHYFESSVYDAVEALIKTKGTPQNWESNATSVNSLGLVLNENVLSTDKLNTLNKTSYNLLKDYVLSTGDYQIIISNNSGIVYKTGLEPTGTIIRVDRIIKLNNSYYMFTFKGWQA